MYRTRTGPRESLPIQPGQQPGTKGGITKTLKPAHHHIIAAVFSLQLAIQAEPAQLPDQVKRHPLVDATSQEHAIEKGKPVAAVQDTPVFYGDVEKIFRAHCTDCHQSGGYAPFSVVPYENARRHARMIAEVVDERRMPPWSASPAYGHFANDPSLATADIERIKQWVATGTPAGEVAKALPPIPPRPQWDIGKPDVVYETEPADIAAEGQMPYRYVRIPTHLTEDRWVDATQIISTSPQVVHHVLIFIEDNAPAPAGAVRPWTPDSDQGGGLNGSFSTTMAAGRGLVYPPGRAKLLPAGATIVMQIHYTPDGTPHQSKTMLGLHFAKQPPTEPVDSRSLANVTFMIPPGDPAHVVTATKVLLRDATLFSLRPHMHLRGKSFRYIAEFPDGSQEVLLDVPKWDFEWQVEYILAKPRFLPKGTRLRAVATYDNSKDNKNNPDPTKSVFFGLQSTEEMMIGYFEVMWHNEPKSASLTLPAQAPKL